MPVFRVEKNRDYTTMSNIHLRDRNLSLKAKGLLSQILSLPDDWNYSVNGLAAINKESRDSIRTAVNELENYGYIVRHRVRLESGKLGDMEYVVYERPVKKEPVSENPTQVLSTQEKPVLDNRSQLNNDIQKTDGTSKEITEGIPDAEADLQTARNRESKSVYGTYHNVRLSASDIERLKSEYPADYESRIEHLSEYMESSGKRYNNHYLTICQWARKDAEAAKYAAPGRKFENYDCMEGESY